MKFFALTSVLLAAAAAAFAAPSASTASVSYDQTYDNAAGSLDTVACSDGPNGLETKGKLCGFNTTEGLLTVLRIHDLWLSPWLPQNRRCLRRRRVELSLLRHLLGAHLQREEHQRPCSGPCRRGHIQHCPCCDERAHEQPG